MSRGIFENSTVLDSDDNPDDTLVTEDPGDQEQIAVMWALVTVVEGKANGVVKLEDGVGGDVIAVVPAGATDVGSTLLRFSGQHRGDQNALHLTKGNPMNAEVSGNTDLNVTVRTRYSVI